MIMHFITMFNNYRRFNSTLCHRNDKIITEYVSLREC